MDLQTAQRLSGRRWQMAKIAALVCFGLACVLLISSLTGATRTELHTSSISPSLTIR
jgi:hypothetical protein